VTRVTLRGINRITRRLATGERRIYYYHRESGLRLEGKPGSPEFVESWQQAEASRTSPSRHAGTFQAWITGYRASDEFAGLADATKRDYLKQIAKIEPKFGNAPQGAIADHRIRRDFLAWRNELAKASPRQADYAITVLGRILSWACNEGFLAVNHAAKPGKKYRSDRSEKIWLPAHITAFAAVAAPDLLFALVLARDTGQRQGDLLRLSWNAYDGTYLKVTQSKTGARVEIPVTRELKRALDAAPRKATTILTAPAGLPWKADHFRHEWRAATLDAALDGLTFHDLRGTAVTRLADAECTPSQIAAITGHSQRSIAAMLDKYQARTRVQADMAIAKLERSFGGPIAKRLQNGGARNKKGTR
jgi:integrase